MLFVDQAMRRPSAAAPDADSPQMPPRTSSRPAARPAESSHTMRTREEILDIVHRECARCERSGMQFCIVLFDPGRGPAAATKLSELMIHNARGTDEVGYFDQQRLCAVLAYTGPAGATRYISRIIKRARHDGVRPTSKLLVYPSARFDEQLIIAEAEGHRQDDDNHDPPHGKPDDRVGSVDELLVRPIPWWKRIIDILVSGTALLVLSPLMLVVALAIKVSSKGPVFFRQQRAGLGGEPFTIVKFRTMVQDAEKLKAALRSQSEQDGPAFKMTHDPRVTRVGKVLRETSIDELPQLWNVLVGDMSLVGPRPLPVDEARAVDIWHRRRLDVTPGLTCIWQVEGRGTVSFAEWVRMDRRYIRRRSPIQDMALLFRTVPAVLLRRGAK